MKEYRKKNPLRMLKLSRVYAKRYPFRTHGINPTKLKLLYNSHPFCGYCKIRLSPEEASADHIIPMKRGGTNTLDNITVSCLDCNYLKGIKTDKEFYAFLLEYISRFKDNTELSPKRESATVNSEIKNINALAS